MVNMNHNRPIYLLLRNKYKKRREKIKLAKELKKLQFSNSFNWNDKILKRSEKHLVREKDESTRRNLATNNHKQVKEVGGAEQQKLRDIEARQIRKSPKKKRQKNVAGSKGNASRKAKFKNDWMGKKIPKSNPEKKPRKNRATKDDWLTRFFDSKRNE